MTTRDKIEFAFLMGKRSFGTAGDVQRLLRFALTLKRISGSAEEGDSRKRIRIQRKVIALCSSMGFHDVRFERSGAIRLGAHDGAIEVPA